MFDAKLRSLPLPAALLSCLLAACGGSETGDKSSELDENGGNEEGDAGKPPKDAAPRKDAGNNPKDASPPRVDASALVKLPCDVQAVVDRRCASCHGDDDPIGRVTLATATDFQSQSTDKKVLHTVAKRKINASDVKDQMPPTSADPLTADEKAVLNAWLDKGAPAATSNKACTSEDPGDAGEPDADGPYMPPNDDDLECYKMLAHNGDGKTPLAVGVARDVYFAYVFAAPWKEMSYGVVVRPVIDNKAAIHHWLLFQDNVPGIPTGAVPQIGAHPTGQLLAAWAPGADPMDFREYAKDEGGVGLELPATTTYTVEFHYNSSDPAAKDASGVEICVAKKKPKNIAAYSWVGFDNLGFPSTKWTGVCRPFTSQPIHIISFMPHMHLKGVHMKGTVNRANGMKDVVHDKPFNFDFQRSYAVDVTLQPGDSITTECTYSEPAVFGQPTNMEMCYLFSMAYPKGALASPDLWGGVAHGSSSCLGQ